MKITGIDTHVVNLALEAPYLWAPGLYPGATKAIIEVRTDFGIVGLGEVHGAAAAQLIREELAPRLIGWDPLDRQGCRRRAIPPLETVTNTDSQSVLLAAYGGVEIALWDIAGKHAELPLYELLGGAFRRRVPFSEYFAPRHRRDKAGGEASPTEIANYCARMVEEHGSCVFEGKVAYDRPSTDVAVVREVRAAIGPENTLRLDANMGWDLLTARSIIRRIAEYDVANIEDPVASFHDMARLRVHSPIPFSTHIPDLRTAAVLGVPDTFVLNLTSLGGIEPTIAFIHACAASGHSFWFYSGDAGIGTAAYLQVSAALPPLSRPHQSLLRWQSEDVIVGGPFTPRNGCVEVPSGPGLGVELDPEAVRRGSRSFERDGPIDPFGVDPNGFYVQLPRQWPDELRA